MLPRWPLLRRQVSGSPSDSYLVLEKSGLTREGEQGLPWVGIRSKKANGQGGTNGVEEGQCPQVTSPLGPLSSRPISRSSNLNPS